MGVHALSFSSASLPFSLNFVIQRLFTKEKAISVSGPIISSPLNPPPNLKSFTIYNDTPLLILVYLLYRKAFLFIIFCYCKLFSLLELPFFPPSSEKCHLILQKPRQISTCSGKPYPALLGGFTLTPPLCTQRMWCITYPILLWSSALCVSARRGEVYLFFNPF